jgi:hypothetical protein
VDPKRDPLTGEPKQEDQTFNVIFDVVLQDLPVDDKKDATG